MKLFNWMNIICNKYSGYETSKNFLTHLFQSKRQIDTAVRSALCYMGQQSVYSCLIKTFILCIQQAIRRWEFVFLKCLHEAINVLDLFIFLVCSPQWKEFCFMLSSNHKMVEASSAFQHLYEQKEKEKEREKEAESLGSYIGKSKLSQKVLASVLCL